MQSLPLQLSEKREKYRCLRFQNLCSAGLLRTTRAAASAMSCRANQKWLNAAREQQQADMAAGHAFRSLPIGINGAVASSFTKLLLGLRRLELRGGRDECEEAVEANAAAASAA